MLKNSHGSDENVYEMIFQARIALRVGNTIANRYFSL